MGLDSYLTRRTYVQNWDYKDSEQKMEYTITKGGKPYEGHIKPENITNIEKNIMYWRKANHIHIYFVHHLADGVDECQEIPVKYRDIVALKDACQIVLDDHLQAETILPTSAGFFFGSTEYDNYYFEMVQSTYNFLTAFLKENPLNKQGYWDFDLYYKASW